MNTEGKIGILDVEFRLTIFPLYHGAKAAIIGLVYNLAFELGPSNVNVNGILPGPVKTPFWDPVLSMIPESEIGAVLDNLG